MKQKQTKKTVSLIFKRFFLYVFLTTISFKFAKLQASASERSTNMAIQPVTAMSPFSYNSGRNERTTTTESLQQERQRFFDRASDSQERRNRFRRMTSKAHSQISRVMCSKCCSSIAHDQPELYEVLPSVKSPVIPFHPSTKLITFPPKEILLKRPSPTESIRNNYQRPLKALLLDHQLDLIKQKKSYAVGCLPLLRNRQHILNKYPFSGPTPLWLVTPLEENVDVARRTVEKEIQSWNATHPEKSQQFILDISNRERQGEQGRFCILLGEEETANLGVKKIEFIIWKSSTNQASIILLGDVQYNTRKNYQEKIIENQLKIWRSLPNLKNCKLIFIGAQQGMEYDHPIGSNDCAALKILHENLLTTVVPQNLNRSRPMDFDHFTEFKNIDLNTFKEFKAKAKTLGSSIAYDTIQEFTYVLTPTNKKEKPSDFFWEFEQIQKTDPLPSIPCTITDNILFQMEAASVCSYLESTRLLELKSRPFRADITGLNLSIEELSKLDTFEVKGEDGSTHIIFEFQKVSKSFYCLTDTLKNMMTFNGPFELADKNQCSEIVRELWDSFSLVTEMGRGLSHLLVLNKSHHESYCALEMTKAAMMTTQIDIIDIIFQLQLHNTDTKLDKQTVLDEAITLANSIPSSQINDKASFNTTIENLTEITTKFDLDRNKARSNSSVKKLLDKFQEITKTSFLKERNIIDNESPRLLPIFLPNP